MRVFAKVVESGSFTGAAQRLGISASMVSQHVKELEERLRRACLTERPPRSASPRSARLLRALHAAAGRSRGTEQAVSDMHAARAGVARQCHSAASAYYI